MTSGATASLPPAALAIGDPRRRVIGRAVLGMLLTSGLFVACVYTAKEVTALNLHSPWEADPYDVATSFVIFFVPLVAGSSLLRLPLCRRNQPLPVHRVLDLLRAGRVALAAIAVTLTSDWISFGLRGNRSAWTGITALLIIALALLTALAAWASLRLRRAFTAAAEPAAASTLEAADAAPGPGTAGPDWLADVLTVAGLACGRRGPLGAGCACAVRWLDERAAPMIRRHPLAAATLASVSFGAIIAAGQAVGEGYNGPAALLFFAVAACGMYAFIATVGSYLGLIRSDRPARGTRRRLIDSAVLACATVPVALAFRDGLLRIAGSSPDATLARVTLLLLLAATAAFAVTFTAESLTHTHANEIT